MIRRDFVKNTLASAGAMLAGTSSIAAAADQVATGGPMAKNKFKLMYAPHFGMFENSAGKDLIDQLKFMADQGFTAIEDNGMMGRPVDVQEKIGKELDRLGMKMGVFVVDKGGNSQNSLAAGKQEYIDIFLNGCKRAVDVAKRVNAKWMTVVPGDFERNLPIGIQTGNVIDALRRGSDILAPHNMTMVLEPLSDTPNLFLRTSDQTYEICRGVNSPACKILFDIYHMQKTKGTSFRTSTGAGARSGIFRLAIIRVVKSLQRERSITKISLSTCTRKLKPKTKSLFSVWSTAIHDPEKKERKPC